MIKLLADFVNSENGTTSIEYAVIASLIAVAIVGSLQALGGANGGMWDDIKAKVGDAMDGAGE